MKQIAIFIMALSFCAVGKADCAASQDEFQSKAAAFLIQQAAKENKGATSDFSAKVGKEASAGTASLKVGSDVAFFVMAHSATETVSGVVKCDKATKKMAVASLGWSNSKTKVSGVIGGGF